MRKTSLLSLLSVLTACGSANVGAPPKQQPATQTGSLGHDPNDRPPFTPYGSPPSDYKNFVYNDDAFGTPVLRATDWWDFSWCTVGYSYWPTFNMDNTKMLVICDSHPYIMDFDPHAFRVTSPLYDATPTYSVGQSFDDVIWSSVNPHVIYWHNGTVLGFHNVANRVDTDTVHNFSYLFEDQYIWQMSKTIDDDTFAFARRSRATGHYMGYVVWSRTKGMRFNGCLNWDNENNRCIVDEVRVDKHGDYLVINTGLSGSGEVRIVVLNLYTKQETHLRNTQEFKPVGHLDVAGGFLVGEEPSHDRVIQWRSLSNPATGFMPLTKFGGWDSHSHTSMLARNERWALISTYGVGDRSGYVDQPLQNEIFQVRTDGSGEVRRIARHYSNVPAFEPYWEMPRANISLDGRFVAYSSNWGGRIDVYVAKIDPAPY